MILDVRNIDAALGARQLCWYPQGGALLHMHWQSDEAYAKGTAGHLRIRIEVNDRDLLYAEYQTRGVESLGPAPENTKWGTREFSFWDPYRNALTFFVDR
jgi:hypothetical protein